MKIIVDSGSSIKQDEKALYGAEILPLRVQIGENNFLDSVDLTADNFYDYLSTDQFPKTSLPSLSEAQELVESYTTAGEDVLIITISAGISGTFQSLRALFEDNERVLVYDSKIAVGGIRFLVEEAVRQNGKPLNEVKAALDDVVSRISVMAIPATLDYLLAGGRLTKTSWMVGSLLGIRPIIGFKDGKVTALAKKRGLKQGMSEIIDTLHKTGVDPKFGIIAAYTQNRDNVDQLVEASDKDIQKQVKLYDNLCPSIACHWGPGAFGYIYVEEKK